MRYLKGYIVESYSLRDVFGIGASVSALAGVGSTILTNEANKDIADATNQTNKEIHQEDREFNAEEAEKAREFNAEEAEKSREFNAEEAEKARQWSSEQSVMQRRKEAGLNIAITGQDGTTPSAPSASSSPASGGAASAPSAPNLVTPTMQTPDVASLVDAGVKLAKASSEIGKNKAESGKILQDTKEAEQRTKQLELLNSFTPQMNKLLLQEKHLSNTEKSVLIEYNQQQLDVAFQQGFNLYAQTVLAQENYNLEQNKFLMLFEQSKQQLDQEADMFLAEWERNHFEGSFRYGISSTKRKGWNIGGDAGVGQRQSNQQTTTLHESNTTTHISGTNSNKSANSSSLGNKTLRALSKLADFNGGIQGGYEDTKTQQSILQNQEFYQFAVEYQACLKGLRSKKYSAEQEHAIRSRMRNLQLSVEGYSLFLQQLGKVKKMPTNISNTLQDLEDQQH